jgi:succinate dehydrogenase/fumarate reductase flavoprotein subunit
MMSSQSHDAEFDVLVIGTGASGMATAVTAASQGLKVLVVEKGALYGGTTARSGGWLWVPGTHLATEQGIHETPGAAKAYLKDQGGTHYDEARVDAFLANGPKAIEFFTSKTCLQFDMPPVFPDYHAEAPGGTAGGRSMVTRPFDARQLGDKVKTLAPPVPGISCGPSNRASPLSMWPSASACTSSMCSATAVA